ncbi:MAG: polysaccharide deacetylase family protein [Bacteroidota bacterium]
MRTLHIGLLHYNAGWFTILQQEGVSFSVVQKENISLQCCSVIILNGFPDAQEKELLLAYLKSGGAILTASKYLAKIFSIKTSLLPAKYLSALQSNIFSNNALIDVGKFLLRINNANELPTNYNFHSTFVGEMGGGFIICFPFDAGELLPDTRITTKYFYSATKRKPSERVSLVSKNEIRKLVATSLAYLHQKQNLPYLHLWYYPDAAKNLFAFRIDTDYGTEKEIDELYSLLSKHSVRGTWFLDVKSHRAYLKKFAQMKEQEIGVHCFEHQTYSRFERNAKNIERAEELLADARILPNGFAAPFGDWNTELNRTLEEFSFRYSSEFAYDYDNLPSYPMLYERVGKILQMPVHPVCIGSLRAAKMNEQQLADYFQRTIQQKTAQNEPLFFYHHPKDGFHSALTSLFETISNANIRNVTMNEFAEWWIQRLQIAKALSTEAITFSDNELSFPSFDKIFSYRAVWQGKEIIFSALEKNVQLNESAGNTLQTRFSYAPDFERIRKFSPRLLKLQIQTYFRRNVQ